MAGEKGHGGKRVMPHRVPFSRSLEITWDTTWHDAGIHFRPLLTKRLLCSTCFSKFLRYGGAQKTKRTLLLSLHYVREMVVMEERPTGSVGKKSKRVGVWKKAEESVLNRAFGNACRKT